MISSTLALQQIKGPVKTVSRVLSTPGWGQEDLPNLLLLLPGTSFARHLLRINLARPELGQHPDLADYQ